MNTTWELISNKSISIKYFAFIVLILISIIALLLKNLRANNRTPHYYTQASSACPPPAITNYQMSDYRFARPLLLSEVITERDNNDAHLNDMKAGIENILAEKKSSGVISTASVYLRELNSGGFISINEKEGYHPASLLKVPDMMVLLRQSETQPGFLNQEIYVDHLTNKYINSNPDFLPAKPLEARRKYTIKELIWYMIVQSDNHALDLLLDYTNLDIYRKIYSDLNMPSDGSSESKSGGDYTLTTAEYSRFMRVLYNATYLSNEDADYALSLLVDANFKDGVMRLLPHDVKVANKFGEFGWGNGDKRDNELHESAIIYINNDPVLLTIMTKGKDKQKLAHTISEIAKYVYDKEVKAAS